MNIVEKTKTVSARTLSIEGVLNARELNNLPPKKQASKYLRPSLIRAAALTKITENGFQELQKKNITTIIDLRTTREYSSAPTPDFVRNNIAIVEAPVFDITDSPIKQSEQQGFAGFTLTYRKFLTEGSSTFRKLFETISDSDGGVLFHCAVGKDRTGVAAALLLDLAGVADDLIIADYAASANELSPVMEAQVARMIEHGIKKKEAVALMQSPPDVMESTLRWIREQWVSTEGYLQSIGLSEKNLANVREKISN